MKITMIALTFAACAVTSLAHAATPVAVGGHRSAVAQAAETQWFQSIASAAPKTRAQVRQELVQAEKDGQLTNLNHSLYSGGA